MQHRLRFIGAKGVHSDSQLSYLFFQYFGLDNGSTLHTIIRYVHDIYISIAFKEQDQPIPKVLGPNSI